jgi:hypothetical protein
MSAHDSIVEIEAAGHRLAGTLVTPATLLPGVLFVHGWGGDQHQYLARARAVSSLGAMCLTFDLRGHADTRAHREEVTRDDNLRDVLAAYDLLTRQRGVDRHAIAVVGSSYGAYLGAILTSERPVKWLGLRAPALYMDAGWAHPKVALHHDGALHAYRRRAHEASTNRALRACQAFRGDVLIVESEHDDIVPHPTVANYLEACKDARSLTYRVLDGADHALTGVESQQAYTSRLVEWFKEML